MRPSISATADVLLVGEDLDLGLAVDWMARAGEDVAVDLDALGFDHPLGAGSTADQWDGFRSWSSP